jgi:hypothetical protein
MDFAEYAAKEAADLVARLSKNAAALADQAARQAAKQAADEGQKVADGLRSELQAAAKEKMSLTASLKEAKAHAESLRGELKAAVDRGEAVSRQLAEARKTNEQLEKAQDQLTAARDEQTKARFTAESDLRKTREAMDAARAELARINKQLEQAAADKVLSDEASSVAHSQAEAAEAKLLAVTDLFKQSAARVKALERAQEEHEKTIKELQSRPPAAAPAAASAAPPPALSLETLDDLLAAFQALAGSTTIPDVLTTFVEQLAAQFPRVALFRVKKSHLQGEHQIGFDLKTDIAKVVMPLGMDSMLARAVGSGQIERLTADERKHNKGPFSGSPGCALAIPIVAAGETLAIVYADDAGASKQKTPPEVDQARERIAEAMQQHVIALLLRMTNELKVRAELQTYARSLIHELQQMYAADEQAGKSGDELGTRLKGNLDYARSIFESRVALEGGDAAALLDDELAALIEAEQATSFGRDLAAAAGRPELATGKRSAAEAS